MIVGIPQQVFALSLLPGAASVKKKGLLHSVLLSTDYISEAVKRRIGYSWGCRVYEHYGMTETGLGGGVFCQAVNGYHMREADLLYEIIDPETTEPVPDGEYGEVVFSTLTRTGMPVLRYRTGDISRFIRSACPCGTVLKTMDKIRYRKEAAVVAGGTCLLTMPELEDCLFAIEGIADFDAAMEKRGNIDCLCLFIETSRTLKDLSAEIKSALKQAGLCAVQENQVYIEVKQMAKKESDPKALTKRTIDDRR